MTIFVIGIAFAFFLVLRVPIAFALSGACIVGIAFGTDLPLSIVVSQPLQGIDSFVYLAIPLFVFAGALMEKSGISSRLIDFAEALVGWLPGGLALSVIVATVFFSGISGSKLAEAGAMGSAIFPRMAKAQYPLPLTVGVVASASAMGEMVPPAILMIVLATLANQSVAGLFAACLLPALVMGICLAVQVYVRSRHLELPRIAFSGKRLRHTLLVATPALTIPIVVLGGLLLGFMTATEAGAAAVVMVLLVSLIYRELKLEDIRLLIVESARTSGAVLLLVGVATILSFLLAMDDVPRKMTDAFLFATDSRVLFMLFSIVVLVIFGSALESVPAALIFVPVFLPVAEKLSIPIIQYLVVVVGALGIGLFLPPLGVGSIMLASIAGVSPKRCSKEIVRLMGSVFAAMALIAAFPVLSSYLPAMIRN